MRSVLNHEALIATVTIVVENDTVVETRWSGVCGGHVEGNGRRLPFRWLKFCASMVVPKTASLASQLLRPGPRFKKSAFPPLGTKNYTQWATPALKLLHGTLEKMEH